MKRRNKRERRRLGLYRLKRKYLATKNAYGIGGYTVFKDNKHIVRYYAISGVLKRDIKRIGNHKERRNLLNVDYLGEYENTYLPNITYRPKHFVPTHPKSAYKKKMLCNYI